MSRILVRTHGNPEEYVDIAIYNSLSVRVLDVIKEYLNGTALELSYSHGKYIHATFGDLVLIFITVTVCSFIYKYKCRRAESSAKLMGLIAATWVAMLAPLSWFILAKGHSQVHTHLNYFLWHLPFTIFGSALVIYLFLLIIRDFSNNKKLFIKMSYILLIGLMGWIYVDYRNNDQLLLPSFIVPTNITDNNFHNGIHKNMRYGPIFIANNNTKNRAILLAGTKLISPSDKEIMIKRVTYTYKHISVFVDQALSFDKDGSPNKFYLVE